MQLYAIAGTVAMKLFLSLLDCFPLRATAEVKLSLKSACLELKKKKIALYRDKKFEAATLDLWSKLNERYFSFLEVMLVDLWGKNEERGRPLV